MCDCSGDVCIDLLFGTVRQGLKRGHVAHTRIAHFSQSSGTPLAPDWLECPHTLAALTMCQSTRHPIHFPKDCLHFVLHSSSFGRDIADLMQYGKVFFG